MSRVSKIADIGVPVPATPDVTQHLIVYFGPHGFTPAYTPVAPDGRIDVGALSTLTTKTVNGASYYDDPIGSELPAGLASGQYDFYFTLETADGLNEGDFSPVIVATVDTVIPPTLGQPISLA